MKSTSRPRKTVNLSDSVSRQLNVYALAASATGVSVLALAQPSEAKVIYTKTHQVTKQGDYLYIDLNNDGVNDFQLRSQAGGYTANVGLVVSAYPNQSNLNNRIAGRYLSQHGDRFLAASAVRAGSPIGPKRRFPGASLMAKEVFPNSHGNTYIDFGPWAGKGEGVRNRYLGLKFVVHGKVHYGWARLSVRLKHWPYSNDVQGTLTGYAYETIPNKSIVAGQTEGPDVITIEPGTLGGLALGRK